MFWCGSEGIYSDWGVYQLFTYLSFNIVSFRPKLGHFQAIISLSTFQPTFILSPFVTIMT